MPEEPGRLERQSVRVGCDINSLSIGDTASVMRNTSDAWQTLPIRLHLIPGRSGLGLAWGLVATHALSGQQEHIVGFHTETEAKEWLASAHGLRKSSLRALAHVGCTGRRYHSVRCRALKLHCTDSVSLMPSPAIAFARRSDIGS
jgi:hypothetical protein